MNTFACTVFLTCVTMLVWGILTHENAGFSLISVSKDSGKWLLHRINEFTLPHAMHEWSCPYPQPLSNSNNNHPMLVPAQLWCCSKQLTNIKSCNSHKTVRDKYCCLHFHFIHEKTGANRDEQICPRQHNQSTTQALEATGHAFKSFIMWFEFCFGTSL